MNKLSLTKDKEVNQDMKLFFMTQIPLKKILTELFRFCSTSLLNLIIRTINYSLRIALIPYP